MKKYIGIVILFICFFLFKTTLVMARGSCPNATRRELTSLANYVKANYEIIDKSETKELTVDGHTTTYKVPNYSFEISIYNLNERLYAEIETTKDFHKTVSWEEASDGVYSFIDYNAGEIYNYTVTIKSSECPEVNLNTIKFTKPRYNAYSEYTYCQNSSNYYCQKFIGTEINISNTGEFLDKIQANNEKNDPSSPQNQEETIGEVIKNNWKLYLIIFASIVLISGITLILIRMRNKKKGWKL